MINRYGAGGILLLLMTFFFVLISEGQNKLGKISCICIDAGHGGKDPGSVGAKSYEKNIVLSVALKVGKLIAAQHPDIKIVYTRDKDVFIKLYERGKFANEQKADLFISIHANSVKANKMAAKGIETYVLGLPNKEANLKVAMKENEVIRYEDDYTVRYDGFDPSKAESYIIFSMLQNLYLGQSLEIAGLVQGELIKSTGKYDRSVRQAGFLVLKDVAMPAILIELGFISNPDDEQYLNSTDGQNKMAAAIARAFKQYRQHVEGNSAVLTTREQKPEEPEKPDKKMGASVTDDFFYAVQVASGANEIKEPGKLCTTHSVEGMKIGDRYRYYIGKSRSFEKVQLDLEKARKVVKDCFIIAVYKGKLINVAEARKLEKKLK